MAKATRTAPITAPKKQPVNIEAPAIKWKLVEIDKSFVRPNTSNPKVRKDKGYEQLNKLTKKFGVIFDGIINADYSLIDGHSRLEMNPDGIGRYWMPDKQLSSKDEKELNALFDVARAGDPDMFMIEQILGDEMFSEWNVDGDKKLVKGKAAKNQENCKYPLVPLYDEKYEALIILCTNKVDTLFIKEVLGVQREMSYKNRQVGESSVITAKKFIEAWKSK